MQAVMHIDLNSYFAQIEQQANPRLRGKPIGVSGGDRLTRTVLGTASVEAKRLGVKTGMQIWQAKKICPEIIIVSGDSDKYLSTTKKFINILKDYTPYLEVFSIDESFLGFEGAQPNLESFIPLAHNIKSRIRLEIGEWVSCSIGISYNKLMAKFASNLQKPDGLVVIANQAEALKRLDPAQLDEVCGIGSAIKKRLLDLGVTNFKILRTVPKECLIASFKSYGELLYKMARGIDDSLIVPFYEKGDVKSVGHRHTIDHDTDSPEEIRQVLLKISEMVALRVRDKNLMAKTIYCFYRSAFTNKEDGLKFSTDGKRQSLNNPTNDGLKTFQIAWAIFHQLWNRGKIRMIGVSVSNLVSGYSANLSLIPEDNRQKIIINTLDKINSKFGDFTLKRAVLLGSQSIRRKPNPYLSDRRFKF